MSVNLFGDDWDGNRDRPGWQWNAMAVGRRLGAEKLGATLHELALGQAMFPYQLARPRGGMADRDARHADAARPER